MNFHISYRDTLPLLELSFFDDSLCFHSSHGTHIENGTIPLRRTPSPEDGKENNNNLSFKKVAKKEHIEEKVNKKKS